MKAAKSKEFRRQYFLSFLKGIGDDTPKLCHAFLTFSRAAGKSFGQFWWHSFPAGVVRRLLSSKSVLTFHSQFLNLQDFMFIEITNYFWIQWKTMLYCININWLILQKQNQRTVHNSTLDIIRHTLLLLVEVQSVLKFKTNLLCFSRFSKILIN